MQRLSIREALLYCSYFVGTVSNELARFWRAVTPKCRVKCRNAFLVSTDLLQAMLVHL